MSKYIRNISLLLIVSFVLISLLGISLSSAESSDLNNYHVPDITKYDNSLEHYACLDAGLVINEKMKSLASGNHVNPFDPDKLIKAILMADSLPDGFEPSAGNTISSDSSPLPIYIFFDNTEDAGLMYVYSESLSIIADTSLYSTFCFMQSLSDISGLAYWDVSNVTDMICAFSGTTSLVDISPLSKWDTGNVESFYYTFFQTGIVDASPLADWNTSNATSMMFMFAKNNALKTIDVSGWDTSKVTSMNSMFAVGDAYMGNGHLSEIIGLENWDVSSVTDMTCMFYGAGRVTYYDIADWDVSSVESFNHMFCDNFKLESLDLSSWNVSNVKTMYCMFDDNYALTTIGDVSHWDTSSLIDAGGWLNFARSFVGDNGTLDLSGWNTENLMSAGEMFRAIKCNTIDLSGWTFDSITNSSWSGAGKGIYYESGNRSGFKGFAGMFLDASELKTVLVSIPGYISYKNAVSRGVKLSDMWTGVPYPHFTLPYIPQFIQEASLNVLSILQDCLDPVLNFLKDPLGSYV